MASRAVAMAVITEARTVDVKQEGLVSLAISSLVSSTVVVSGGGEVVHGIWWWRCSSIWWWKCGGILWWTCCNDGVWWTV